MANTTKNSLTATVFFLLFLLNVLLQMLLSREPVGRYLSDVFTNSTGIFEFIWAIMKWFHSYFFTPMAFYMVGLIIAMEFLVHPLLIRYEYLTFRPNFFVSILSAFYVLLVYRIMLVVLG